MWVLKMSALTLGICVALLITEMVIWNVTHRNAALALNAIDLRGQGLFFAMVGAWFFIFSAVLHIVITKLR
jgi:hypothetical protein